MKTALSLICITTGLGLITSLFFGVLKIEREHKSEYEFFRKTQPSVRWAFENPAQCGECDIRPLAQLDARQRQDFSEYCLARYGIAEQPCHAMLVDRQRLDEKRYTERLRK